LIERAEIMASALVRTTSTDSHQDSVPLLANPEPDEVINLEKSHHHCSHTRDINSKKKDIFSDMLAARDQVLQQRQSPQVHGLTQQMHNF